MMKQRRLGLSLLVCAGVLLIAGRFRVRPGSLSGTTHGRRSPSRRENHLRHWKEANTDEAEGLEQNLHLAPHPLHAGFPGARAENTTRAESATLGTDTAGESEPPGYATHCDELIPGHCAPYVVIVGAAKCGTNTIHKYLMRYPGALYISDAGKERLIAEKGWAGEVNWKWSQQPMESLDERQQYNSYFGRTDWRRNFTIDKSTGYLSSSLSARHMSKIMPRAKVLAMICDPTKRVWSDLNQWHYKVSYDIQTKAGNYAKYYGCKLMLSRFTGEVLRQLEMFNRTSLSIEQLCPHGGDGFSQCSLCGYIRGSMYANHLRPWVEAYKDTGGVLIVDADKLRFRPRETVEEILRFLKWPVNRYPSWRHLGQVHSHVARDKFYENFPPRVRKFLNRYFRPSVRDLESLANTTFPTWQINHNDL